MAKSKSRRRKQQSRGKLSPRVVQLEADLQADRRQRRGVAAAVQRGFDEIGDLSTPVGRVVEVLLELFGEGPVTPVTLDLVGGGDRARGVADALSAARPGGLCALSFAALVARSLDGDDAKAAEILRSAVSMTDEPIQLRRLAYHLASLGCVREAVEIVEPDLAADPAEMDATSAYVLALAVARDRFGTTPEGLCLCGSGKEWVQCCRPFEAAALERFLDRDRLDRLPPSVDAWVHGSPLAADVSRRVATALDGLDPDPAEWGALTRLVTENAWLAEPGSADGGSALAAFAADTATPADLADTALQWRQHVLVGLWQVVDPVPAPGVWCTDIVTGLRRYVAIPPEQLSEVQRWSVMLAALVPDRGVWRTTGAVLVLRPAEGDMLAEGVNDYLEGLLEGLGTDRRGRRGRDAPPAGVVAPAIDPVSAEGLLAVSTIMGAALPCLAADLRTFRHTVRTSDGEDMWFIQAQVELQRSAETLRRLREHPDTEPFRDDLVAWRGAKMTPADRARVGADVRAHTGDDGRITDDPDFRWMLGFLEGQGHVVTLHADSRERFVAFLDFLRVLGDEPRVLDESRWAPSAYLWYLGDGRALTVVIESPERLDAWEESWPDQPLRCLGGRTPRQASRRPTHVLNVEALLRELENQADQLMRAGRLAPDVDYLRREIGVRVHVERLAA